MRCTACGSDSTGVAETRDTETGGAPAVRRRRFCAGCGRRWSTLEIEVPAGGRVVTHDLAIVRRSDLDRLAEAIARVFPGAASVRVIAPSLALPSGDVEELPA